MYNWLFEYLEDMRLVNSSKASYDFKEIRNEKKNTENLQCIIVDYVSEGKFVYL